MKNKEKPKEKIQVGKVDLRSMNIVEEQKRNLKKLFPEVFNEKHINWEKLKATLGEIVDKGREFYYTHWPGKNNCWRIIQEPSLGTLKPCKKDSVDWDNTQNLFIEGDNLEVLKLLQKSYYGKVKMIYIDPPYNTGKDFIYPDKYSENLETYLQYTGQKSKEGKVFSTNMDTDGRFHSKWLNMMFPRLYLAKNLLREDGVIFISIDDNEVANLRKICDEIFGEENFIADLIWKKKTGASDAITIATITEHILIYIKACNDNLVSIFDKNRASYDTNRYNLADQYHQTRGNYYIDNLDRGGLRYSDSLNFPITCPDGQVTYPNGKKRYINEGWIWKWSKKKVEWALKNGFIEFRKSKKKESGWAVCYKNYMYVNNEGHRIERAGPKKNLIDDVLNANSAEDIKRLFTKNIFSYSKPVKLLKTVISYLNFSKNSIILDFFAGSGTTAHAVYEKNMEDGGNRKYILVQLPEPTQEKSEAYKAGFKTIADIGKERIRRAIKKIKEENQQQSFDNKDKIDLGFKVFKLQKSHFKIWEQKTNTEQDSSKQVEMHLDSFIHPQASDEDLLYEILLKTGYPLTTPIQILKLNQTVYSIDNNAMLICLEKTITKELIKEMARLRPARVVFLDIAFENKDHLKTNAKETFASHGVLAFETI